jgi:hypothetical protein
MKFAALSVVASLSLLVGCAASTASGDDLGDSQDDVTASSKFELKSSSDSDSIQAQLYKLMDAFKGEKALDISKNVVALTIKGAAETGAPARSITCTKSSLVHATLGQGVTTTDFFACTLTGFNKIRDGVALPSVNVQLNHEAPLANNLFSLMAEGDKKGGFDVLRSGGDQPTCCDRPISTTMSISDSTSTLSCTNRTGGFAFMVFTECSLAAKDASDEVEVSKGTLVHTVGIGGENTGFSVKIGDKVTELVLSPADAKAFVDGRVARVTGTPTSLSGVETHDRPAIKVTNLLVCPAPHTTLSMMPPVTDDASWMGANCPDLDIVQ